MTGSEEQRQAIRDALDKVTQPRSAGLAGTYPASVEEVADEVFTFVMDLERGPVPGLARNLAGMLFAFVEGEPERERCGSCGTDAHGVRLGCPECAGRHPAMYRSAVAFRSTPFGGIEP